MDSCIYCMFNFVYISEGCEQNEKYDWWWRLRLIFDSLYYHIYAKFCNLSEHLAVSQVIVKFKGSISFRQYIPMKRKHFDFKIYNLRDDSGCADDMSAYLGKGTETFIGIRPSKLKSYDTKFLLMFPIQHTHPCQLVLMTERPGMWIHTGKFNPLERMWLPTYDWQNWNWNEVSSKWWPGAD